MKCQDFREVIDSYLSDELLTETNHDVLRHLEVCADCRREIEVRRDLLAQIRSVVKNSPQFQIRGEFSGNLRARLKQSAAPKNVFWTSGNFWLAVAAMLILTVGLSIWFVSNQTVPSAEITQKTENSQPVFLEDTALGDHQNCAVKYNLAEEPVKIDLASAKYANLRQAILLPLQNALDRYEFLESHTCKYDGHLFTHIIFRHQGKTLSVLLTDLQNYQSLKDEEIVKLSASGYQLARFDAKNQAFFVVSDLPQTENLATAEILMNSVRQHFTKPDKAKLAVLAKF
ncbi:MAG: zf-HC2 domain-containing protein [Acidobacteria bacterium]|nr:zf-HC2 domain-containing protein [Acidobacteriota bacterium]